MKLQRVDARAFLRQFPGDEPGQREIHIVAAKKDVLAYSHAFERQLALLLRYGDEREVRGAAADIEDQNQVAQFHLLAPVPVTLDPRVERRLRLFEQRDIAESGAFGGLQRELTRHGVERRGYGDKHLLLGERRLGKPGVPRPAQVIEIAR